MKRILLLFLLLFLQENLSARLPDLIPYRKVNLWGYCDSTKKIIIEPKYDFAYEFSGGSAIVLYKNTQAIIDAAGNELLLPDSMIISLSPAHHGIRTFHYDRADKDGNLSYGLVNDKGQIILEPINAWLDWVSENYLFASSNTKGYKMGVYDFRGRQVLGYDYDMTDYGPDVYSDKGQFILCKKDKYGIVDTSGNVITPFAYRYITPLRDGYYFGEKKKQSVILDPNGKIAWLANSVQDSIFKAKGDSIFYKSLERRNGRSALFKEKTGNEAKIGLLKSNGDTLIKAKYDLSWGFDAFGLALMIEIIDKNTKAMRDLGYIDRYGTEYWED
jgi:hypothetical protein